MIGIFYNLLNINDNTPPSAHQLYHENLNIPIYSSIPQTNISGQMQLKVHIPFLTKTKQNQHYLFNSLQ